MKYHFCNQELKMTDGFFLKWNMFLSLNKHEKGFPSVKNYTRYISTQLSIKMMSYLVYYLY